MNHDTMTYYQDHDDYDELVVDDDEEYQENRYLRHHQGRGKIGGLGLVHEDDDSDEDDLYTSRRHRVLRNNYGNFDDSDEEDEDEDVIDAEDDYDEVDMDPHNIQLLSGSMSVRSPFLDAIREEEEEEAVFSKPSSYPTLGTGKHFHRLSSGDGGLSAWVSKRSSLEIALADKQLLLKQQQQQQEGPVDDLQQSNFNNTNQSDSSKPRGPRPPLLLGRPRSNSSLTRVTTGFDIQGTSNSANEQETADDKKALRDTQMSPENPIHDMEVKRVLEGAAALASASATSKDSEASTSVDTTPLPSSTNVEVNSKAVSLTNSTGGAGRVSTSPSVSFGQDTQKSIDEFFGMVKTDLDKRIQEAIREVEQKFLHRVQKLEEQTATLAGTSDGTLDLSGTPKSGSLMESLTRPLPADQNPGGSIALRREILSHVTEKVGDLDLRVNQMEVLVSYKLVDIESKVKDLHGAHNTIAQKVHQVAKTHSSNMQGLRAGEGVGQGTITAEEERMKKAMQSYRDIDSEGRGAEAFIEPIEGQDASEGVVSIRSRRGVPAADELADTSSAIVELRQELQTLGVRYQELNDGLLSDLMGQMRDAKLMLLQTVDEVDGRVSKRIDRIEADMHSKLMSEIEGRVQERVRAMEQTSTRLEKCFDKMEGRLAALETVLASRRPRPESMYQLLQQQYQQQQLEENGALSYPMPYAVATYSGSPSSAASAGHRSIAAVLFSETENKPSEPSSPQSTRPRRRTLAENGVPPDHIQSSSQQEVNGVALTSKPLEGSGSQTQAKAIWIPSSKASSSSSSRTYSSSVPSVPSPLERGTMIGNRVGTIHAEPLPRTTPSPSTTNKDKSQKSAPTTPIKERFQNALASAQGKSVTPEPGASSSSDQALRLRRVSLSSFDASSLSALKPVRATTPTTPTSPAPPSPSTVSSFKGATSIATSNATSTSTITSTTTSSIRRSGSHDDNKSLSHSNISVKSSSSSSLLTAKLKGTDGNIHGTVTSSGGGTSRTMQRAMTIDTLNAQSTTTTTIKSASSTKKTVTTPVQGPSSYRELLHFWKAGGSGSNSSSQSAAV
ncbi:hypothetical protein B0O80DRAFT_494679 [Mortierella sp. GBAus27b]|nr:hypothetical protein BGX31_005845 [Mortierella sp. GBA43]KAI8360518.1 hypothetical protein B0O80DRAFT_494679 [Mortierella sp. GBAus27b]